MLLGMAYWALITRLFQYASLFMVINMFKIIFSENMKKQLDPPKAKTEFATYNEAYNYAVSRWGSGVIEWNDIREPRMGLSINKVI